MNLRERYLERARSDVLRVLTERGRVFYDDAWRLALLETPLVWESDLKGWIRDWQRQGSLVLEGLRERERVPSRERGHVLIFRGSGNP
jgi:hypothetical protein